MGFEPTTLRVRVGCANPVAPQIHMGMEGVEPSTRWLRVSYSTTELHSRILVELVGFEPTTHRLKGDCSKPTELQFHMGVEGLEPSTSYEPHRLKVGCSTNWATHPKTKNLTTSVARFSENHIIWCYTTTSLSCFFCFICLLIICIISSLKTFSGYTGNDPDL